MEWCWGRQWQWLYRCVDSPLSDETGVDRPQEPSTACGCASCGNSLSACTLPSRLWLLVTQQAPLYITLQWESHQNRSWSRCSSGAKVQECLKEGLEGSWLRQEHRVYSSQSGGSSLKSKWKTVSVSATVFWSKPEDLYHCSRDNFITVLMSEAFWRC